MRNPRNFLSVDLGAESGRVMLGSFDGSRLAVEEVHRFDSRPVRLPDGLHTDVLHILSEVMAGLSAGAAAATREIGGLAVDTWGVDFGLVDARGALLGVPYHYRDIIAEAVDESALRGVTRDRLYERTGVAFTPINTLYQLVRMRLRRDAALDAADGLLMMPDLFTYWLSGRRLNEFTIATTSQCYDPTAKGWAVDLLEDLGLPARIFGEIVPPGTVVGELLPSIAEETAVGRVPVIAAGGHDTALAVAAVPARGEHFVYLSSGTWSLIGTELPAPFISAAGRAAGFTNEGGVAGTTRFLKNLCGLWLVQECRRSWAQGGRPDSYDDLTRQASRARAWRSLIDVADPEFAEPGDMPRRIQEYCRRSGQSVPEGKGAIVRCALDSLALKYRAALSEIEGLLGRRLEPLHIVGGGSRNALLCQLAANATGREVHAGPVEATAAGSIVMQAIAAGDLGSVAEGREVVRRSFDVSVYEPQPDAALEEAYGRLTTLHAPAGRVAERTT
jgi:rhamnulokinase